MNKASLKALGIEDEELISKIIIEHGKDIEGLKSELKEKSAAIEQAQKQLGEANEKIESFKSLDVEGIKAAADEWKAKAEQAKAEADATIKQIRFDHAVDSALSGTVRNVKAVRALLDPTKLTLGEDGKLTGLSEQLDALRKTDEFLFADVKEQPRIVSGTAAKQNQNMDPMIAAARAAAGIQDPSTN